MKESDHRAIQTIALVAVPLVVAYFGYVGQSKVADQTVKMQTAIADQSVRKDFVQMAIGILSKPPASEDDKRLREWALQVLDKNSPIPFPTKVREDLLLRGISKQPELGDTRKLSEKFLDEFIPHLGPGDIMAMPRRMVPQDYWMPGDKEQYEKLLRAEKRKN